MRHSPSSLAFLKIGSDQFLWAEGGATGWKTASQRPENGFFFWAPDFFLQDSESFLIPEKWKTLSKREALEHLPPKASACFADALGDQEAWSVPDRKAFEKTFTELKNEIREGRLQKAVPLVWSRRKVPENFHEFLPEIIEKLINVPEPLIPFLLIHNEEWMFGATPEILLRKEGQRLFTHAVAGTTFDKNKSLLNDPKERSEHQLVIDFLQTALKDAGTLTIHPTLEKELPRLKHLITHIHLDVDASTSLIEVAKKLHPTPALGGSPTDKAFAWLFDQPPGPHRRRYGAPFGYADENGNGMLVVAIRCLQVFENQLHSLAGAGVVRESLLESEWNEMNSKRESVFKIFEES